MEAALRARGVEVVISVMGGASILDQLGLIEAIRAAGTVKVRTLHILHTSACMRASHNSDFWHVKFGLRGACAWVQRFLPSEFGHDVDRARPVGAGLRFYEEKRLVRRAAEASGVPYTFICCNSIAGWPYHDSTHPSELPPPLDRFQIYGDGDVRGT